MRSNIVQRDAVQVSSPKIIQKIKNKGLHCSSFNTKIVRIILGDQLDINHAWFKSCDTSVVYVLAEVKEEVTFVRHHIQKLCACFLSIELFARQLRKKGHQVLHFNLDENDSVKSFTEFVTIICDQLSPDYFQYQTPDEYRLQAEFDALRLDNIKIDKHFDNHFFVKRDDQTYFSSRKNPPHTMENFYRKIRKKEKILIENGKPMGGKWNYDIKNREKIKVVDYTNIPPPINFQNNVTHILERIKRHNIPFIGSEKSHIDFAVNSEQASKLLDYFCKTSLKYFGTFQDAMTDGGPHRATLFHSRLSFTLNTKIISPRLVVNKCIKYFEKHREDISIEQIEGFVRQILGWREFVRIIYWHFMPKYKAGNFLELNRKLPSYFWSGNTKMKCVSEAVQQSLKLSYAHHIHRLMITGNFALLVGVDPDFVDEWYLGIYADAVEWVQLPNTRGMSQYADGGIMATKPYISSGNYINKMSDYCGKCFYNVKERSTELSCPFNSLYWNFLYQHQDKLSQNHRLSFSYKTWNKMSENHKSEIIARASRLKDQVDML